MSVTAHKPRQTSAQPRPRPRGRLRWLRRGALVVALLLLLAAVLPPATSGAWLAGFVSDAVPVPEGAAVRIGRIDWGWWGGIRLAEIRIDLPDETAIQVRQADVQADIWDLVRRRPIGSIVIDGVHVTTEIDYEDLPAAPAQADPPAKATASPARPAGHAFSVCQFVLSDSSLALHDRTTGRSMDLFVPAALFRMDPRSGSVDWRLSAREGRRGIVASEGHFVVPRLADDPVDDVGGQFQIVWDGLELGHLPAALLRRWGLEQLRGGLSGRVEVELAPDWTLRCRTVLMGESLLAQGDEGEPVRLETLQAELAGQWRMIQEQIRIETASLRWPGGSMHAGDPALVYDGRTNRIVQSNLTGRVGDVQVLRDLLAQVGVVLPEPLELAGGFAVDARIRRDRADALVDVTLAGDRLAATWPGVFQRRAGQPLEVQATARIRENGSIALERAEVAMPGGHVSLGAELVVTPEEPEPDRRVELQGGRLEIRWDDFAAFVAQSPWVAGHLAPDDHVAGPGGVTLRTSASRQGGVRADMAVELPAEAEVRLADWLRKPAEEPLRLEVAASLSPAYDRVGLDRVALVHGGRTLLEMDQAQLEASPAAHPELPAQHSLLMVRLLSRLRSLDLSGLQDLSPRLAETVRQAGAVDGPLAGQVDATFWADTRDGRMRLLGVSAAGELDLDAVAASIPDALDKPAGEPMQVAGSLSYWRLGSTPHGYVSGSIDTAGFRAQAWYEADPRSAGPLQWSWGWLEVSDVTRTAALLPAILPLIERNQIIGSMSGQWEWTRRPDTFSLRSNWDLTGLRAASAEANIRKAAGLPARVAFEASAVGQQAHVWRVAQAQVDLGESQALLADGELEWSEPWARLLSGQGRQVFGIIDFAWPILRASARTSGTLVFEDISSISPELQAWLAQRGATGTARWTSQWQYQVGSGVAFKAAVDAQDVAFHADGFDKPAGTPLRSEVQGLVRAYRDAQNRRNVAIRLEQADGMAASLTWALGGDVTLVREGGRYELSTADLSGRAQSKTVEDLAGLAAPARPLELAGHVAMEGRVTFSRPTGWFVEDMQVAAWPLTATLDGTPLYLEGMLNIEGKSVSASSLRTQLGATRGRVTFDADLVGDQLAGRLGTVFDRLDIVELVGFYRRLHAKRGAGSQVSPAVVSATGAAPAEGAPSSAGQGAGVTRPAWAIDPLASLAHFAGRADDVRFPLDRGRPPAELPVIGWTGTFDRGRIDVEMSGAFEGGPVTVDIEGNLAEASKPLKVFYKLDRALPSEATARFVTGSFPGLRVDGPVTLLETLWIDLSGKTSIIPSEGEMIVEGGEVWGAAAPQAIIRIFPGLELARFRFHRLHNWFDKDAEGKTTNRMIFRGAPWSVYMNGWSLPDGRFRYEVGVDLLGPMESEYWAEVDRARIPLFIKTGQVVAGKIVDEKVSYLNPQQIAERIVKDNVLTVTYHLIRQQVFGGNK